MADAQQTSDPIDLIAAAIAAKLTLQLAAEIARAMRKLPIAPRLPAASDPTAAERQRRRRSRLRQER